MKTWVAVVTVRLPADGVAQDTRAVFSAIPAALDDIVDEADIAGIEELFDICELLDDVAEPHPAALSASHTVKKLSDGSRHLVLVCIERLPNVSRPEASTIHRSRERKRTAGHHARQPSTTDLGCGAGEGCLPSGKCQHRTPGGGLSVRDMRVALVGYGLAGRFFHAPLVAATNGLELSSIVTSSAARTDQAAVEHPRARVFASIEDLWEATPPELVVVATANRSHVQIASTAIEHRVPVVVEKPVALTAAEAEALADEADRTDVMLTVFQNRRWDADQLTLRRLIEEDALGEVIRYESRFERWRPTLDPSKSRETLPPEEGGGVLLDLGVHLVDQALVLFGPVTEVYAEIDSRRGAPAEDDVFITLRHASGSISHLHASAVTPSPGPRLRVQGTAGAFLVPNLDPQEAALRAGARPDMVEDWGKPEAWEYGRLIAGERSIPVLPEPGNWPRLYMLLRDALQNGGPPPVDPRDAVLTLRVLEGARQAAREHRIVTL